MIDFKLFKVNQTLKIPRNDQAAPRFVAHIKSGEKYITKYTQITKSLIHYLALMKQVI